MKRKTPPAIPEQQPQHEVVSIDGKDFVVPPPWVGNRLIEPKLAFSSFQQIPVAYTHNMTKLYIRKEAYEPLVAMLRQAEKDGVPLKVESAYRSKAYQKRIFKRMLDEGRTFDDIVRYVAPPGYSQHMFGFSVDFFPSNWRFADTPQYSWLQENAGRFGFAETYSEFNHLKMPWESWHWGCSEVESKESSSDSSSDSTNNKLVKTSKK